MNACRNIKCDLAGRGLSDGDKLITLKYELKQPLKLFQPGTLIIANNVDSQGTIINGAGEDLMSEGMRLFRE